MTYTVAMLGVGRMGGPMAANIAAAGHTVRVHNRTRAKAEALAGRADVVVADDPASAADGADVIVTMVADEDAVRALWTGERGALAAAPQGCLAIEMSTIGPDAARRLADLAAAHAVRLVDAPVSGSTAAATEGSLLILAGGDPDDVERARPVLDAVGSRVIHMGPLGTGQAMKLAVNNIVYGLCVSVGESLVLAERAGIARTTAYEVFAGSAVAAPVVHYRRDVFERPDEATTTFSLELAAKDLELIEAFATDTGATLPQAPANLRVINDAIDAGYADEDLAAVAEYLRSRQRTAGIDG